MTMCFSYFQFGSQLPIPSLGGRLGRPRPILGVTVLGPAGYLPVDALLDTGADDTVFPESLATLLGVDLSSAPTVMTLGVGGTPTPVRFAVVALRIADNQERRQWDACVGFTTARFRYPMLGFAGFLQYFTATFHGDREEVELTVNGLYPGT
jgi:hypothetical protein